MTRREPGLIGLFIVPGHRNKVITDYLPIHLDRLNTKDAEKALGIIRKQARALRHCVDGDDGDFYKLTDKELLESILHMTAVEHYRTGEKTSAAIYTYACALHHACLYG